ncbi:hypothetical protein FEM48_Zijuj08G0127800 [Ziziphus jujuba var. spinosa]|nr:hypothetical protein FEM48_Zijuj08G0127800 [Ziziphus jujuba var. spinosa]
MEKTSSVADEDRCSEQDQEEDVSLCDLPVNLMKEGNQQPSNYEGGQVIETVHEEFDFVSVGGGLEMCVADEVFFQGQILPLRLSISSDNGLCNFGRHDSRTASRCISRSESMDHGSLGGFRSISSGSSSCCSGRSYQHSSSTSSSNNSTMNIITRVTSESRIRNNFHSLPSPKPQIRASSARLERISSRNQKSSIWDFFRMGLVRTPDIDLQEFKVVRSNSRANRASVSRNSSVNSENATGSGIAATNGSKVDVNLNLQDQVKQKRQKFLSGCRCSIETVASNAIIMKNRSYSASKTSCSSFNVANDSGQTHAMKELKMMRKKQKQKQQQHQQQGKQALSHHRTYEWLKELSHANFPMYV